MENKSNKEYVFGDYKIIYCHQNCKFYAKTLGYFKSTMDVLKTFVFQSISKLGHIVL